MLILDNCNIHHAEAVRALVEDEACEYTDNASHYCITNAYYHLVVCKLIFLPPYSPDRNPIEFAFGYIKSQLRRGNRQLVVSDISEACYKVTPVMAKGWFRCAGYM